MKSSVLAYREGILTLRRGEEAHPESEQSQSAGDSCLWHWAHTRDTPLNHSPTITCQGPSQGSPESLFLKASNSVSSFPTTLPWGLGDTESGLWGSGEGQNQDSATSVQGSQRLAPPWTRGPCPRLQSLETPVVGPSGLPAPPWLWAEPLGAEVTPRSQAAPSTRRNNSNGHERFTEPGTVPRAALHFLVQFYLQG